MRGPARRRGRPRRPCHPVRRPRVGRRLSLLVVTQSRSGSTRRLRDAVLAGAAAVPAAEVRSLDAVDAVSADVLGADGIVCCTSTHFGSMAGLFKDFLERVYLDCLDRTVGRPWALVVKGASDVDGSALSVERVVAGLRWRAVADPLKVVGDVTPEHEEAAWELGATMAAGLDARLWA